MLLVYCLLERHHDTHCLEMLLHICNVLCVKVFYGSLRYKT